MGLPSSVALSVSLVQKDGQAIIKYRVKGFSERDMVNFALVERGLTTDVTAGENAGRTLHHDNVVKDFICMRAKDIPAQVRLPLYRILDRSQASVIVYVQNPQTMLIEDARQVDLEND